MDIQSFQRRLWHRLCSIPGLAVVGVGGSLVSFKYARWSLSAYHYVVQDNLELYAFLIAGLVLIPWAAFAVWAFVASVMEGLKGLAGGGPELPEYLEGLSEWHVAEVSEKNEVPSASHEQASKQEEPLHKEHFLHRIAIPWVLAIHVGSWGAAVLSISLVHIVFPLKFWLVFAACAVLLPVGIVFIGVSLYALMLQEPEAREQGETATEFLIRKMDE